MKRLILAILLVMLVPAMAFSVGTGTYTTSYNPDQATNYKHKVLTVVVEEGASLNVGVADALVGAMVGGYAAADHADDTSEEAIEILAANGDGDGNRAVLIIVKCTETFAATTNKPIFEIGDGSDPDAFAKIGHGGSPNTMSAGDVVTFAGELGEKDPLEITVTNGTGGSEAGKIEAFAVALPASA
jgi:hypothetical protein